MRKSIAYIGSCMLFISLYHCTPYTPGISEKTKEGICSEDAGGCATKEGKSTEHTCKSGTTRPCYNGKEGTQDKGICRAGLEVCKRGVWGTCLQSVTPKDEICDGKDNNCDGKTDEGCECIPGTQQSCYPSSQGCIRVGEHFNCTAPCLSGKQTCQKDTKWGPCENAKGPQVEECNGKDDDCDGKVDNTTAAGGPCTVDGAQGQCKAGHWKCTAQGRRCISDTKPSIELCDGADNDCDGKVDNIVKNIPLCEQQKGVCHNARKECDGINGWKKCTPSSYGPSYQAKETLCDGKDNDCDGHVDNGLQAPLCKYQKGICKGKVKRCNGRAGWSTCTSIEYGLDYKTTELCDNKDNDCNGQVDENVTQPCYSGPPGTAGKGLCKQGIRTCTQGQWSVTCTHQVVPQKEICDNKDNDCDGQIDEHITRSCFTAPIIVRPPCKTGIQSCSAGVWSKACLGQILPKKESCNGLDDDCDGLIDNNLTAPPCSNQKGVCKGSVKTVCSGTLGWQGCLAGQSYSQHSQDYQSKETKCDGQDNDCDGQVDAWCVSTLAGKAGVTGNTNGIGSVARFYSPTGITIDPQGNVYVADRDNYLIRKVAPSGYTTDVAGKFLKRGRVDGSGSQAQFSGPLSLTYHNSGTLYVIDQGYSTHNDVIRTVRLHNSMVSTPTIANVFTSNMTDLLFCNTNILCIANSGLEKLGSLDIVNSIFKASLLRPSSASALAYDPIKDSLYFADTWDQYEKSKIYKLGITTPLYTYPSTRDYPAGLVYYRKHGKEKIFIANALISTIEELDLKTGKLRTIAGTRSIPGSKDGYGKFASFNLPQRVIVDPTGRYLYVSDTGNHTIRRIILGQ